MSTSTVAGPRVAVVIYEDAPKDLARAYRGLLTAVELLEAVGGGRWGSAW